jgi:predicted RNA-binding Zn-ribbon protein involved in translation (DUF1610 family)
MNKHEIYLKEIQTELNKNWGSQPKSWWNVRLNVIRSEHEATEKELEKLQKRDVAIKPNIKMGGMGNTWEIPYCPICDTNIQSREEYTFNYCPICGQKINWNKKGR